MQVQGLSLHAEHGSTEGPLTRLHQSRGSPQLPEATQSLDPPPAGQPQQQLAQRYLVFAGETGDTLNMEGLLQRHALTKTPSCDSIMHTSSCTLYRAHMHFCGGYKVHKHQRNKVPTNKQHSYVCTCSSNKHTHAHMHTTHAYIHTRVQTPFT